MALPYSAQSPSRSGDILMDKIDLAQFNNAGFSRGASRLKEALWLLCRQLVFSANPYGFYQLKRMLLCWFGARSAAGLIVKPGAKISFPWRFESGADVWIGEDAFLLSLDKIHIGANVCISQRAFLCTGSHDWSAPHFTLITKPIVVEEGAWICADVFIGPGVTIGRNAVITAGSVVTKDMPPNMICSGNPCVPQKPRVLAAGGPVPGAGPSRLPFGPGTR